MLVAYFKWISWKQANCSFKRHSMFRSKSEKGFGKRRGVNKQGWLCNDSHADFIKSTFCKSKSKHASFQWNNGSFVSKDHCMS